MKFRIQVEYKDKSKEPWWEEYDKNIIDPTQWGKEMVDYFNKTLHPGEKPRRFLKAEILGE